MIELIVCLIKYTAIFVSILYAYTKLLRLKLKGWDLFDIPIFIALSAVLYFVTVYIKILVPIGFLILGIFFLYLRFRKTLYDSVSIGTISSGLSIVLYNFSFIVSAPVTVLFNFINEESIKIVLAQLTISLIQIACTVLLFKIKRFKSGVNPKGETATFEILLFFSVGCIFTMMLFYTSQNLYEIVLLAISLCGLLLIVWWRRHITYNYREAIKRQNAERMENTFEEFKLNNAEKDYQLAVYAKQFHYLNKALPDCALLADRAAAQTDGGDAKAVRDMLQNVLREMNLANGKCSLQNVPQSGVREIDAAIIQLFTSAERKNFKVSADISPDFKSFTERNINKNDIHIMLRYLCDNAVISALASPKAKVRVEFATANSLPVIRVYDSGEQFDEDVISKLGKEQITTRAGVGGNGIGLYTVFNILAKYNASFTLDEAPQLFGFNKCIEISFDGRRSVAVRTHRQSVVNACSARKDICVELIEILRDGTA